MARGYLSGVILGAVVSLGGAIGLSLLAGGPVMRDTKPEATALDVPAGSEFNQSRDDREASLPASEPVAKPGSAPRVAAPQPDTLSSLAAADTDPGRPPQTGTAQAGLDAPEAGPGTAPQVAALSEAPVQPGAPVGAPQVPQAEPELSISTEPAQPKPPSPETEQSAFAEPDAPESEAEPGPEAAPEPEPEPAASGPEPEPEPVPGPAPVVQSAAPVEPRQPSPSAEDSAMPVAADPQAAEPLPVEIAAKPADPVTPGRAPAVSAEPATRQVTEPEPVPEPAPAAEPEVETAPDAQSVETVEPAPDNQSVETVETAPDPEPVDEPALPRVTQVTPERAPEAAAEPTQEPTLTTEPDTETAAAGPVIRIGKPASDFRTLGTGSGIQTGRLPSLATAPDQPEAEIAAAPAADDATLPPIKRFSAGFDDPGDKPRMAIVLIDEGAGPVGMEALSSFPYPLSFAVDTSHDDAAEKTRKYRDAGFEVLAMVRLPEASAPADVEVAMPVLMSKVPEAVGVMEAPGDGIQFDRKVSDQVARILADSGHGLLLFPKGLNTAQKLAAKNGVPSSVIFRDIDGKGQKSGAIRRFLNYGVLNAANEGGVVMVGRLQPDTVTALLLWGLEDRAQQIALAPISQLLSVQP